MVIYASVKSIQAIGRIAYDDKVEGMEITALSTAGDSCIGNMSDIITGFCD